MLAAREAAGLTQEQVRKRIGIGQSTLADAESKALGSSWTAQLAGLYGVDALWLADGTGKPPHWEGDQHSPAGVSLSPVAHDLSLPKHSDALPEITWESLVGNVPDSLFLLALRDDALAPDYPRGTAVVWSKTREPKPGRLVLVRDKYGRDHARAYHAGRAPGEWLAAARNPAFPSFEPEQDGLQILAVHRGVLDAEDDAAPPLRGQVFSDGAPDQAPARQRKRQ